MEPVGVIKLSDTPNSSVFLSDEEVRIRVVIVFKGDAGIDLVSPVVHYSVTDYWDRVVASGMEPLHQPTKFGGWVEITPQKSRTIYSQCPMESRPDGACRPL